MSLSLTRDYAGISLRLSSTAKTTLLTNAAIIIERHNQYRQELGRIADPERLKAFKNDRCLGLDMLLCANAGASASITR